MSVQNWLKKGGRIDSSLRIFALTLLSDMQIRLKGRMKNNRLQENDG